MKQLSTSARGRGHKILKFFAPILPSRCTRKLKEEEQALETIARIRLQDEPCPKHAYEPNFVGEIILGGYQLERLLARTDDFVIWLVSDLAEARIWSVKIYHVSTTHSGKQRTPGEKEIQERLYTTSVSPHLLASVKTFDLLEGKHLGFMMPLCGTLSLEEYRSRAPGCIVPVSPARQISGQVVRALEALHGNGIMHGHLEPTHVLFGVQHMPGHVRSFIDKTSSAVSIGHRQTPQVLPHVFRWHDEPDRVQQYMCFLSGLGSAACLPVFERHPKARFPAPEFLEEKNIIGCQADVWALGCLLFKLLTGASPVTEQQLVPLELEQAKRGLFSPKFPEDDQFIENKEDAGDEDGHGQSPEPPEVTIETALLERNAHQEEDVRLAAVFIARCLVVDPARRASAQDLVDDPWLQGTTP